MIRTLFCIVSLGLLAGCTTASYNRSRQADGSSLTHAQFVSLDGEKVGDIASGAASEIGGLLPVIGVGVGGTTLVGGLLKLASSMGSRSAHKARDLADAAFDEGAARGVMAGTQEKS